MTYMNHVLINIHFMGRHVLTNTNHRLLKSKIKNEDQGVHINYVTPRAAISGYLMPEANL